MECAHVHDFFVASNVEQRLTPAHRSQTIQPTQDATGGQMRIPTVAFIGVICGALGVVLSAQPLTTRILFSRAGPGEPGEIGLFVANADGTAEQPLGSPATFDYNPAWFH